MARSIEDFRNFLTKRLREKTEKTAQERNTSQIRELLNTERAELDVVLGVFNLMFPPDDDETEKKRSAAVAAQKRGLARKRENGKCR